jgi:hypothetical protein
MAASHKSLEGWLVEGSAVWLAFHIDIFAWPAARQLLAFPALLQLFSRGAYLIQWGAPLLLIWPSRSTIPRLVGLGVLGMHLGFLPVLKLGLFPWVSIVCLLPPLPRCRHDRGAPAAHRSSSVDHGPEQQRGGGGHAPGQLLGGANG